MLERCADSRSVIVASNGGNILSFFVRPIPYFYQHAFNNVSSMPG